jgi:hypothetical protein
VPPSNKNWLITGGFDSTGAKKDTMTKEETPAYNLLCRQLREELGTYVANFEGKNGDIGGENDYAWGVNG